MVNICHSCVPGFWLISPTLSSLGCPKSPIERELGSAAFSAEILLLLECHQLLPGFCWRGGNEFSVCCSSQKEFVVLFSSLSTCCERQSLDIDGAV